MTDTSIEMPILPETLSVSTPPIDSTQAAIDFLKEIRFGRVDLDKETEALYEELDRVWQENERLMMEVASYKEMDEKFSKLKEIVSKMESVAI